MSVLRPFQSKEAKTMKIYGHDIKNLLAICEAVTVESTCIKHPLGCVLVLADGQMLAGTNGPPEPLTACDPCPRWNRRSGEDLYLCPAVHAERAPLLIAAKYGMETKDSVLFSDMGIPCKDCLVELIAAGVSEIVTTRDTYYDELSREMLAEWLSKGGKHRVLEL